MEIKVRGVMVGQERASDILVRDGRVVSIRPARTGRADRGSATAIISPTLFDIQVNGVCGIDLQDDALTPEDVLRITEILAAWGVSHWIPTLITAPIERMARACRTIVRAREDKRVARAVPGIHIEGPYISPMDGPRGAHAREHVRPPSVREFDRLYKAAEGQIAYVTLAPELEGAPEFIKSVAARGVVVALGHHNGNAEQIARAVDAGARLSTHLGNGLASTIHRHHNPLWPQLADDRLMAALIADLEHLPPSVLKTFVRAKGPENIILASDCVHIAGLTPGRYNLAGLAVELLPTGRICLSGTDLLAGSSLMLLQGVVNAARVAGMTLAQAFAAAGTNPARLLRLKHRFVPPRPGDEANFILFDIDKKHECKVNIRAVFIAGGLVA